MTLEEVYEFYGNVTKAADAVEVSRQSFHAWLRQGFIPENQQKRYEKLTHGALKAEKLNFMEITPAKKVTDYPQFRYFSETLGMCDVHSLTYFSEREPRIMYYCPLNRQLKFTSFNQENLMRSLGILDEKGILLFEGDILLMDGREDTVKNGRDYELLLRIQRNVNFLIIGNIFEGKS